MPLKIELGEKIQLFMWVIVISEVTVAQNQIIWSPKLAHEWKTITMSWQVEQLKEELSSKEAQGEELKKRAAGLQSEVFAVRFTSLCAVIPQWDPAGSGFWVAYTFILSTDGSSAHS